MTPTSIVPGEEEVGLQKRCPRCGDWWPWPDPEFWFHYQRGARRTHVIHSQCRACASESKNRRRRAA